MLVILFYNTKVTIFAREENSSQVIKEGEIVPHAEWRDVPSGCKVVSNGPTLAYYRGTRYAAVSRYEWSHTVVNQ